MRADESVCELDETLELREALDAQYAEGVGATASLAAVAAGPSIHTQN